MFMYLNIEIIRFVMSYYYINLKPKSDHVVYMQDMQDMPLLVSDKYSTIIVSHETINQKCYVNKMYLY